MVLLKRFEQHQLVIVQVMCDTKLLQKNSTVFGDNTGPPFIHSSHRTYNLILGPTIFQ